MPKTKKLTLPKIEKLISLFKYIISQKPGNKSVALKYLNSESVDIISEAIYNLLYNEKLNSLLSTSQKRKLRRIIKPNIKSFEDVSKKKVPLKKRQNKLIQQGGGIGTILLTLIPILSSFLSRK